MGGSAPTGRRHVVVVGGGVTGLAAAHALRGGDDPPAVTVLEASGRLGGKILTTPVDGIAVDAGPDSVLARVPWGVDLLRELGLGDELVSPVQGSAYVFTRGRLRRIPEGLVLGVPADLASLARSGVLSPAGVARAGLDLVLPRSRFYGPDADSVGAVVRARFGREVAERLVDPLLGGINAGDADRLSLRASAPQLGAVASGSRSLLLALRAQQRAQRAAATATGGAAPVFVTLPGGLGRLIDALALRLRGAKVALDHPVERVERDPASGTYVVHTAGPNRRRVGADAVVLATPAPAAAAVLRDIAPAPAARLAAVPYSSVALVTLALPSSAVGHPLDASGLLVPRREGLLVTACSFGSSKWAHWARPGRVLLRVSAGRYGDERALALDDGALVDALLADLRTMLGLTGRPDEARVTRWERSFPQYEPGHLDRVAVLEAELREAAPGVALAGAAYRGVGIPACIRQGREAATAVAAHLAGRSA
ncbi:MAG: protoporphyrinogen oxidase [Acidimicrobiales bacterium]|nr:protoporphyrinogen oxidase [Acidimicrobiales bacterium]